MYKFSVFTAIGMMFVLVGGALVTKTDSGAGCGTSFPLCNGKFLPMYTLESLVEYSHRAVSGFVGVLVFIAAIWVLKITRERRDIVLFAMITFAFTFIQAILGAMAVISPQSSPVLALHFGISLIAFAGSLLLALALRSAVRSKTYGESTISLKVKSQRVSKAFQLGVWFTTIYCYIVVYIGAYVRHTDSSGGCSGWPLCNGQIIPELTGATGVVFLHRVAAFILLVAILWLAVVGNRAYRHLSDLQKGTTYTALLVILQVLTGAWVSVTSFTSQWHLAASLFHSLIIAILFASLCYLCVRVFVRKKTI